MESETAVAAASVLPRSSSGPGKKNSSGDGSTVKPKPVRRDLEKRRQQNLQAQKKYREKLRKRLDQLDQLETFATSIAQTPALQNDSLGLATIDRQSFCQPIEKNFHSHGDLPFFSSLDPPLSKSNVPASSSEVILWDPAACIDPFYLDHETNNTAPQSQYCISYIDCGCLMRHVQVRTTKTKEYRDLGGALDVIPCIVPADPYTNNLRIQQLCLVQAVFANSFHLGITDTTLCDNDGISPFFRPRINGDGTNNEDDPKSEVHLVQRIFRLLKPDVRPIKEQITTKHSPMIDVLPFPTLRKNLIIHGDMIDPDELFDDLLNGLVCWGGTGVGRRDRNSSTGFASTGTPWDSRSWEARTWFLQKYWVFCGGEEGELVRQSEWWRSIRGEDINLWAGS
ncbi:hypothetical protein EJ02DRAFT_458098 [Clathrospora elynae]|uniref:BZIP domain-containing protein n=1 Tax=Clathrospora elynae TaxID=706981 RepID=A0A6A5SC51_9PLEO|nr:hypothetical protein EJ02DRAFT_458098 [Clathrospora elynae]